MTERATFTGSPSSAANFFTDRIMDRLLAEQTEWEKEREELRQENADLTEKINQLEVALGQLLKEVRYLTTECCKRVAENEKLRQEAMPPSA